MARGTDFGAGRAFVDAQARQPKQFTSKYGQQQNGAVNPGNDNDRFTVQGLRRFVGQQRGGYQGSPSRGGNYGPGRGNVGSHGMPGGNFNGPW